MINQPLRSQPPAISCLGSRWQSLASFPALWYSYECGRFASSRVSFVLVCYRRANRARTNREKWKSRSGYDLRTASHAMKHRWKIVSAKSYFANTAKVSQNPQLGKNYFAIVANTMFIVASRIVVIFGKLTLFSPVCAYFSLTKSTFFPL